jgi:hypothetical protein
MQSLARKPNYNKSSTSAPAGKGKGAGAPYNLVFSVGDELIKLTGLFQNKSKSGSDYLGVKKIRSEDAQKLIEVINAAQEGTEVGVFIFENKPK